MNDVMVDDAVVGDPSTARSQWKTTNFATSHQGRPVRALCDA